MPTNVSNLATLAFASSTPDTVVPVSFFIDEYEVVAEIGRGAFGVVYRARDRQLSRDVAIKVLQVGTHPKEDDLVRFRGEAETLAQLQHDNIVQVFNTGMFNRAPYLVMEHVAGGTLATLLAGQPREGKEAAEWVETLARAAGAFHDKQIVHRDLKPTNVLRSADGRLKITDFGLAKWLDRTGLSVTGQILGTPSYMAPEQAAGDLDQIQAHTDVYALGAILYECLTGRPPFLGPHPMAVLDQVRSTDPLRPSRLIPRLDVDLQTICLKCLEKAPSQRYRSAHDLAADLRRYLNGQDIVARPTPRVKKLWRLIRRHPARTALVVLGITGLALSGVYASERAESRRQVELEGAQRLTAEREYDRSLKAIDKIMGLVVDGGPLHNVPKLEPLHDRLMSYYEELSDSAARNVNTEEDRRIPDAYLQLGKLNRTRGTLEKAKMALDKAKARYKGMSDGRKDVQHLLARTLLESGRVNDSLGDAARAEQDFSDAERLLVGLGEDVEQLRDLGAVQHWRAASIARNPIKRKQALADYSKALETRQKIVGRGRSLGLSPEARLQDERELARTFGFRGDLRLELEDLVGADADYWESHRLRLKLAAGSQNPQEEQFQLARSFANFAGLLTRVGTLHTAMDYYQKEVLKRRRALVAENPAITEYQTDLADGANSAAELLLLGAGGKLSDDEKGRTFALLDEAEKIYRKVREKDREAVTARGGLANSLLLRARVLLDAAPNAARGALDEAKPLLDDAPLARRDPAESAFRWGALYAMRAELKLESEKEDLEKAMKGLQGAFAGRFRRLHPDTVLTRDRAFQALRGRPEFQRLRERAPGQAAAQ